MVKLVRPKVERIVWGIEKLFSIIMLGAILMIAADLAGKHISDFYPWKFVAGGIWTGYVNWRRNIH